MVIKTRSRANKSFLSRIFFSFTLTIVTTIIILSLILYKNFETIGLSLINTYIKDGLSQISYSTGFMTDSYRSLAYKIQIDPAVNKLYYTKPDDFSELRIVFNQLSSYISTMPFIHSIYVCSGNYDRVYLQTFSTEINSLNDFYDKKFIETVHNRAYSQLTPIPRKLKDRNNIEHNVYSFIYSTGYTKKTGNILVLNVLESWIRKSIDTLDTIPGSKTIIIDKSGNMVISSKESEFLSNISNQEYVQKLLLSKDSSGYFIMDINGVKTLVSFVDSPQLKWKFVRIIPYSSISGKIVEMRNNTIFIGFIILLTGIAISLLISRKLYKPISKLEQRLASLELDMRNNFQAHKRDFLKNLIMSSTDHSPDSIEKNMDTFKINFSLTKPYFITLLKIDGYQNLLEKYSQKDLELLRFAISNIANELFAEAFPNEAFDAGVDKIVLIANVHETQLDTWNNIVSGVSQYVQSMVKKHLDISVCCIISSVSSSQRDISVLYEDLISASNYRVFYGHGSLIFYKDVCDLKKQEYTYPSKKEELLIDALMLGRIADVERYYYEIINSASEYSYNAFHSAVLHIALSINSAIDKMEKSTGTDFAYNFSSFTSRLSSLETLKEINLQFIELFKGIISCIEERKTNKHDELINKTIATITEGYYKLDLSPEYLADYTDISAIYLSRLFKKVTGKSIMDFITDVRLEKARKLLATTNITANDIALKVGFSSSTYFFTVFKKTHGMTPSDFRKSKNDV